jgi:hypothetical protein
VYSLGKVGLRLAGEHGAVRFAVLLLGGAAVVILAAELVRRADRTETPSCGGARWTVKTLQDRPRLLPVRDTTVAYLVSLPYPPALPDTRLPFERHVFRVTASVTAVHHAHDRDLHLVLDDGTRTMFVEAPSPSCTAQATPVGRRQMARARRRIRLCDRARVTGVAFFDLLHGEEGQAPNGIELHPILRFRCLRPRPASV